MKPIQRFYLGLVAVLTALWAFADPAWRASDPNYFVWRASLTNLTGVLGIAPRREPIRVGADSVYAVPLHPWVLVCTDFNDVPQHRPVSPPDIRSEQ